VFRLFEILFVEPCVPHKKRATICHGHCARTVVTHRCLPRNGRSSVTYQSPQAMGSCGLRMTQCGFGPCFFQNASGSLGACLACSSGGHHDSKGGNDTHCGCAEQYGRAPGLARYCWLPTGGTRLRRPGPARTAPLGKRATARRALVLLAIVEDAAVLVVVGCSRALGRDRSSEGLLVGGLRGEDERLLLVVKPVKAARDGQRPWATQPRATLNRRQLSSSDGGVSVGGFVGLCRLTPSDIESRGRCPGPCRR
jgi:hypothetical protein